MFAFHQTATSAQINLQPDTNHGMFELGLVSEGTTSIPINWVGTHLFKPKIRLHYSDFFGYKLNMTESSPGSLDITYEYNGVKKQKIVPVQVKKFNFSFYLSKIVNFLFEQN